MGLSPRLIRLRRVLRRWGKKHGRLPHDAQIFRPLAHQAIQPAMVHAGVLPPDDFRLHAFWQPLDAPILVRAPASMKNKRQHEVTEVKALPLQVLTSEAWYLPAVEFLVGPGVAEHAICFSGFSRSSWAVVAPSCVASDRVPRFRAAFGRRTPAALLATEPLASARSRHVRDARGHPAAYQGGQVTQLQAPGAYFRQHAATRSAAGLRSPVAVWHIVISRR